MKITSSSNTTITSITPKVIEAAHGFLLNTQYYTKEKLIPIPFETCKIQGSPYSLSIRKQLNLQAYSWSFPNDEAGIFKDSTYPNRYYMRVLEGYISGNRITRIIIFEETENGEVNILEMPSLGDYQLLEFIGQDNTNIYYTARTNTTCGIFYMNKLTYAISTAATIASTHSYSQHKKIYEDDIHIWFIYYHLQNMYCSSFNKVTKVYTASSAIYRGQETATANLLLTNLNDTPYQVDDNTYGLFLINAADQEQPIDLYLCDTSKVVTSGFSMQSVNITWNNDKSKIELQTGTIANTVRSFIAEFDGVKYLNVVTYQVNFSDATWIPTQGIYTFRIESSTELTFTGYNQIDGTKQIGGFIYDESKEHLIVAKQNAFQILKFNSTTLKYESTNFEITRCYSVGLDELQRVWYIKTDSSVHMINLEDAQSVEIEFEKEYYDYTGSAINTYINFSALNYLNEEFIGIFELTISGPAIFAENSSNVLRFNYDGTGKQQIGITITGASPITIYPKFIS